MAETTIRVALVDDHPMLREGTAAILAAQPGIAVVGQTGRGAETLALVEASTPDVLLLDIRLPDMSGLEVARRVRTAYPRVAIVILSNYEDAGYVRALLRLGARLSG